MKYRIKQNVLTDDLIWIATQINGGVPPNEIYTLNDWVYVFQGKVDGKPVYDLPKENYDISKKI